MPAARCGFAGAVMGYLAKTRDLSFDNLKQAVVYGGVIASFTVEDFAFDLDKD